MRAASRDDRVAVVLITYNAAARVPRALERLSALPEQPALVVVDNASTDGTPDAIRRDFPHVRVIRLDRNLGAAGRNHGVAAVAAPYVAFAEDDSWYEPGALSTAADLLDRHPGVALINAHVRVGEDGRDEPLHREMVGTSVSDRPGRPGHRILSFLEGVSIVRRSAFLDVGGFDERLGLGGPEEHLAADLLTAGWDLRYVPEVGARHMPDHREPSPLVRRMGLRNALWFAWGRRPLRPALRWTAHLLGDSPANRATLLGIADALRGAPRVLRHRRPLPPDVERDVARLDPSRLHSEVRSYGRRRPRRGAARRAGRSV
jgi:N-acetylglucosaminyl-diphospho-decaprenol L-rhamnosyltransferase